MDLNAQINQFLQLGAIALSLWAVPEIIVMLASVALRMLQRGTSVI